MYRNQKIETPSQGDNERLERYLEFVIPLIFTAVVIVLTYWLDLDLLISRQFFDSGNNSWPWSENATIFSVYKYGPILPLGIFIWGLIGLVLSFIFPRFQRRRLKSLFIVVSILVVPVFLTHVVIKEVWKRPRPRDTIEFSSNQRFYPLFEIADHDFRGRSFISGHSAVGFILTFLFFLNKKRSRKRAYLMLVGTILFGCVISFARISVGGHFFTDTYFSFVLCWYFNFFLYYLWYLPKRLSFMGKQPFEFQKWRLFLLMLVLAVVLGAVAAFRLIVTEFGHDLKDITIKIPKNIREIEVFCSVEKGNIHLLRSDRSDILIKTWAKGAGPSDLTVQRSIHHSLDNGVIRLSLETAPLTWFWKYQSHTTFYFPKDKQVDWTRCKTKLGQLFE